MKKIWNFEDILDFSYFSRLDGEREEGNEQTLHHRDRQFFLDAQATEDIPSPSSQYCLELWLKSRRLIELNNHPFLPGNSIREAHALFRLLLLVGGIFIGCSLGLSYFVYTGETPLNVFQYLTIFIVPQLLLILLLTIKTAFSPRRARRLSSLHQLLHSLFTRFFYIFKQRVIKKLSPERQSAITTILTKEQGSLSFWPLFLASQIFGLGFNFGVLVVTVLKIVTSDLAFGWQSTLQLGPENLFAIVKIMALPWSWLLSPEFSYPSLQEIEGSRIILKDGILNLLTQDLTSWWPFLLLCLACYGLIPRIFLFFFGFLMEQRSFKRYLQQNKYEIIIKHMLTPIVSTQAPHENNVTEDKPFTLDMKRGRSVLSEHSQKPVLVLIPDDIYENCSIADIQELLLPHNYLLTKKTRIFESYDTDRAILTDIAQMSWNDLQGIIVLVEVWMVPIEEQVRFLRNITEAVANETQVVICFLGRPTSTTVLSPPLKKDVEMWKIKINDLLDRIVCLEPLTTESRGQ